MKCKGIDAKPVLVVNPGRKDKLVGILNSGRYFMKKRMKKQTSTVKPMSRCCLFLTCNPCGKLTAELLALGDLLAGHALPD